jgi:hypothetical protein
MVSLVYDVTEIQACTLAPETLDRTTKKIQLSPELSLP